jgi:uncharacterized protein (TIGR02145 family)
MKKFLFFLFAFIIPPVFSFAQKGNIHLTFRAFDYYTNMLLTTDSILISNPARDCDTLLVGTNEFHLEWTDGIEDNFAADNFAVNLDRANPFNGTTGVNLFLKKKSTVSITLYNAGGNRLSIMQKELIAGIHHITVTIGNAGIYFLVLTNGRESRILKLINGSNTGHRSEIRYAGRGTMNVYKKKAPAGGNFIFQPGDMLVYTEYSYGYETDTITDTPSEDKNYDFRLIPKLVDFSSDTTVGNVPLTIQFYGITNMNIVSWQWDFGDGSTSDLKNPVHQYMEPSTYYTVKLTALDAESKTYIVTKENYIHTIADPSSVNFTADYTHSFAPQTIQFAGYTNINANYWQWSFGDGGTATVQNPSYEYLYPGVYTVKLTVYSNNGTVSTTKEDYIHIGSCPPTVTDDDGNTYETVRIGNQCWMKSNINVGIRIDGQETGSDNMVVEKYCYDNSDSKCNEYGGLYSFDEMMKYNHTKGRRGICPEGWYIPGNDDWIALMNYLGGETVAGGKMKEQDYTHWDEPNTGATNESGFTAIGAGRNQFFGMDYGFSDLKKEAFFRTSTDVGFFKLTYGNDSFEWWPEWTSNKYHGFSVRCVKKVD